MFSGRSSVHTSVPFWFCRYLKNCEVFLHQTWYEGIYPGGIILYLDLRVKGHWLFCGKIIGTVFYIL